jgi:hypothetical protein
MRKMLVRLQPTRPDKPNSLNEQNKLVSVFNIPIGLLVAISARITIGVWLACGTDRKDPYHEYNKTHGSNDCDRTDRSSDCIVCESERWRIWWRILRRFQGL